MNYTLTPPPLFTDTLDFENVNAPFIALDKNQYFLTKKAENLWNSVKNLRIFTDKDAIDLHSNGVNNFFKVKLKSSELEVLGDVVILSDGYVKDDTPDEYKTGTTPLNMKELIVAMQDNGFLKRERVYTDMLKKSQLLLSNMIPYSDMLLSCISKENDTVELVNPSAVSDNMIDENIVDRKTMTDEFIHKTIQFEQLNISNDNISSLTAESAIFSDVRFVDGYTPSEDSDAIDRQFAIDNGESSRENIIGTPKVIDPIGQRTPINKTKAIELTDGYISKTDKEAENIIIKRASVTVEDDFIVSSDEAKQFIEDYFANILDPKIENIDEFKNYLSSLCDIEIDYLDYTFSISGGKIYIGFDYNNMHSIFNSEAIERILFEEVGEFDIGLGITFDASRYFSNQEDVDKLAAYAQIVSRDFDISRDTIGKVFKQIQGIVAKLCIMTPDAVPEPEMKIEVPVFKAAVVTTAPMFPTYVVSYIAPFLIQPFYMQEYKVFILTEINLPNLSYNYSQPVLNGPYYIPDYIVSIATPPVFTAIVDVYNGPTMSEPKVFKDTTYKTYSRRDGVSDRLVFFDTENGCKRRHKIVSTRTINMMEIGVVLKNIIMGEYFWYDYERSLVMSAPRMVASLMSDVACLIAEKTDYYVNFSVELGSNSVSLFSDGTETGTATSNCSMGGGDTGEDELTILQKIVKRFESNFFELNGIRFDPVNGNSNNPILVTTELLGPPEALGSSSFPSWETFEGNSYRALVEFFSDRVVALVDSYTEGRRLDKWNSIQVKPLPMASLNELKAGNVDIFLAEYAKTSHEKSEEYVMSSVGDPFGVFASGLDVNVSVKEAVYPYDNVLVGNTGTQTMTDRIEYMKAPPPLESGSKKIYTWAPNFTANMQKIERMPYTPVSSSSQGVISTFEPIIYVEETSNGSYRFDAAGGSISVSVGRAMVDIITYFDGSAEEEERYTLTAMGNTIVLGPTESTGAPSSISYARDMCDPWESPYQLYGILESGGQPYPTMSMSGSLMPFMMFAPIGMQRDIDIENVRATLQPDGGCGSHMTLESGISPAIKENISTLDSIDTSTLKQEPGETPGALMMALNMQMSMYSPEIDPVTEAVKDKIKNGRVKLCMTFGCIDGKINGGGDILAQGLSQEEITAEAENANPVTYVAPTELFKQYCSLSRQTIGGKKASVFTVELAALLETSAIDIETGEPFNRYYDPNDDAMKNAEVKLSPEDSESGENATSLGVVSVNSFASSGMSFLYKHAGQDPTKPVVQGYQGSAEINFVSGTKLVATVPSPVPNTVVTNMDDAQQFIERLDLGIGGYVYFFINNRTIQAVIADSSAALSENRTVKVQWA